MNSETRILWILLLLGGAGLLFKAFGTSTGLGAVYVAEAKLPPEAVGKLPPRYIKTDPADPAGRLSWPRTVGLWLAALFTLSIFSYLYRDNVFYKLTEAIIVGVSAGYYMVVGFWDSIVKDLLASLWPSAARAWAMPGIPEHSPVDATFLVPLVLGLMLFLRFFPAATCQWIAQWPLAFVVGTFAGLRLVNFLDADFISQIRSSLLPLVVIADGRLHVVQSLQNTGLVLCLLACLSYFVFSIRHQGPFGWSARMGIWVLMMTFGAAFAFTVMGRITLLTMRLEFLFRDWLRLI
uniref:Uncharacterized protein n=1 Tax=Schlesneria paludicola TaxID=360056 RepID=A0A7C4LPP0_9PLAN